MALSISLEEFYAYSLPEAAFKGIDPTTVQTQLLWATDVAMGYVRKRYKQPINDSLMLKAAICSIAAYTMLSRRGYAPNAGNQDTVRDRYEDAMQLLQDIAKGLAELGDVDATPEVDEGGSLAVSDAPEQFNIVTGRRCSQCGGSCNRSFGVCDGCAG